MKFFLFFLFVWFRTATFVKGYQVIVGLWVFVFNQKTFADKIKQIVNEK